MEFQQIMLTQTVHPPLDDLGLVEAHYKLLSGNLRWSSVGVFIDEAAGMQKSVLTVLIEQDKIVAVFRVCLNTSGETLEAVQLFTRDPDAEIIFSVYQGEFFSKEDICALPALNQLWNSACEQSINLDSARQVAVYEKLFSGERETGRGPRFSAGTKQQVNLDAHGRCMFEGCGARLLVDELSGQPGNYAYLAHNVASSENGPRGIPEISEQRSNDPANVLLLCDKHHRLIDKVAVVDYPAYRLSKMRADFCTTVNSLLGGLSREPVPAIAVLWPVQRNVIAPPSELQIAQSLAKMNWRMALRLMSPSNDNDAIFRDCLPAELSPLWPAVIDKAAGKITDSLGINQYRAALFAFGPMPQLIALGAKLGNKQEIIPMLRYRDGNQWIWPADKPQGAGYQVHGLDDLDDTEEEIILTLSFTNHPPVFDSFAKTKGLKKIEVRANRDIMGNGAIGHPDDGIMFMAEMQRLLHLLKGDYDVNKIHLLPCASNAICVFFGKAFDIHHPDIQVYDFGKDTMIPALKLINVDAKCQISVLN